jgi:hypothetical protein
MAITKTYNITANNGDVYADAAAFQAVHGMCGLEAGEFVRLVDDEPVGTITLNAGGNGVQVVLEYEDQAKADAHAASWDKAEATVTITAV